MAIRKSGVETLANTMMVSNQTAPAAAGLVGGRFVVGWMDDHVTGGRVRAQLFNADGSTFGSEFVLNTNGGNHRNPAFAAQSGGFFAAFDDGFDTWGRRFDAAGNPLVNDVTANTNQFQVNTTAGAASQVFPAIAELAGGRIVVGFTDSVIRARIFTPTATPVVNGVTADSNDFQVDSLVRRTQGGTSISELVGGGFLAAYADNVFVSHDIEARLFDSSGNPLVNGVTANTDSFVVGSSFDPSNGEFGFGSASVGLTGGGFVVVWQRGGNLVGRLFDSTGTPVVTSATDANGVFAIAGAAFPAMAATPTGGFLVTYAIDDQVFAELFDASAQNIGNPFLINTTPGSTTTGILIDPTVSLLPDGRMVIAWTGSDADGSGIRFQVIDPNAAPPPSDSFNGDGFSDILWQNDNGTPGIWLMNGLSVIADSAVGFNPGPTWKVKAPGDFNADGSADILWQNDDGTAGIWLMNGFTRMAGANVGFNPGPTWKVIDSGDFNADGKADILWQNDNGTPGIWTMDGLTRTGGANVGGFNPGPTWKVKAPGDFNADGSADILWQNDDGTAGIWLMNGFTRMAGANVGFNPGPTWKVMNSGDFNADGKADILWQNDNGTPGIWTMDGLTRTGGANVGGFNPGPTWKVKTSGDYNGDGKADILWQNDNGQPGIWLMDGFSVVADGGVGFNPGPTWHVIGQQDQI